MSQELEECKAQLRAAVAGMEESKKVSSGNTCLDQKECNDVYQLVFGMNANLTIDYADGPGVNLDEQHALRQLKAGERVLTQVRRERNDLQDANIQLGVELNDVRDQLADSVKENKRLRRGIFNKCLNESFKGIRRRSQLTALCL